MLNKLLFLLLLASFGGRAVAQTQEQEARLKAVFIYNFIKYIDWDTIGTENDFVIGVIGSSGVTGPLMEIAKTNPVKNKQIIIRVFSKPEEIGYCQILFIPEKLPFPLHAILGKVGRGVLTVSEETGYANLGTAFNFFIRNDKLKFEANLKAIYSAGLRAGSQLLKLATIVDN
jgi:YfiR/HmsC-like